MFNGSFKQFSHLFCWKCCIIQHKNGWQGMSYSITHIEFCFCVPTRSLGNSKSYDAPMAEWLELGSQKSSPWKSLAQKVYYDKIVNEQNNTPITNKFWWTLMCTQLVVIHFEIRYSLHPLFQWLRQTYLLLSLLLVHLFQFSCMFFWYSSYYALLQDENAFMIGRCDK